MQASRKRAYFWGVFVWLVGIVFALKFGSVADADTSLILQLRLPRVILASAMGMALAVSGATLQALFTNPLCEPYTLGISSGSAFGAVLGASVGVHWVFGGVTTTAFLGALIFAGILHAISLKRDGSALTLLLGGVMLGFLGSSLVAVWMALADPSGIQGALYWLLGDLSRARIEGATVLIGLALILSILIWRRSRELDALLMGEEGAQALGVDVGATRRKLIFLTSSLVALAVSGGGMVGFIGLIVPHFVRRNVGSLHRNVIPLSALWGAAGLCVADGVSRVAARPYEIPVGVVTALIGAPLFLWIMLKRERGTE